MSNETVLINATIQPILESSTIPAETAQIITPYLICGISVFVVGIFFFYLNWQKLLDGLEQNNQDIVDNRFFNLGLKLCIMIKDRPEEPISPRLMSFFVCIFLFYFGLQSVEVRKY